jgi:hypothetical protein
MVARGRWRYAETGLLDRAHVKALLRVWPELMAQQFVLRLRPAGTVPG